MADNRTEPRRHEQPAPRIHRAPAQHGVLPLGLERDLDERGSVEPGHLAHLQADDLPVVQHLVDREWLDILLARNAPASAGSWRPGSVFALSQASVRKAARRMLGNAHLANPPAEVERWNGAGRPAFSFGWYAREAAAGRPAGILLQLASLKAFA